MSKPVPPNACPICHRPTVEAYRPFCSKRCADLDLAHWLSGGYAIPSVESDAEEPSEADEKMFP